MPSPAVVFGTLDGEPVAWTPREAFVFDTQAKSWKPANAAEVGMDGKVLSPAAFAARFPALPAPPMTAFHTSPAACKPEA